MSRILVTGATGTVGSHVVRDLVGRDLDVRAFVRDRARAARMFGHGVELVTGDFADVDTLRSAMRDVDTLFLLTPNHPRQLEHELALLDAAIAAGVSRVVKASTIGADPDSPLEFWAAHGRSEARLRERVPSAVILRSSFYMSGLFAASDTVRSLGKLFAPIGDARIGMVDPRDVAEVAAVALTNPAYDGTMLVLTGPEAITDAQVARALGEVTGRPVEFVNVPDEAARQGMVGAGVPEWIADNVIRLYGILRGGAAGQTTDTVARVTGRPARSFAQFARDHAAVFQPAVTASASSSAAPA